MQNKANERFGEEQRRLARLVSDLRPNVRKRDLAR